MAIFVTKPMWVACWLFCLVLAIVGYVMNFNRCNGHLRNGENNSMVTRESWYLSGLGLLNSYTGYRILTYGFTF